MFYGIWMVFAVAILFFTKLAYGETCETGTIVPLYLYPEIKNGVHNWQPLIDAYSNYSIPVWAIVNVHNGPGLQLDANYVHAINLLKANGIHTLGYVLTNYTRRAMSLAKQDVDNWKTFYEPEGIFFDEMSNVRDENNVNYYKELDSYAKGKRFNVTVGNPGTAIDLAYVDAVDTIMIYESSGKFPHFSEYCANANYPKKKWGIFPYNLQSIADIRESILAAKNCVGFIYVTDDFGDNPWDTLPAYLNELFSLLKI
ncbi:Spherulin-4 [Pseudolycoriella hygida]|uniref:Spherulin-4 n=1 Tax=Pseudolycoriella hygida TaxID=35572 RepID=A0A9Q0MXG1_9DIPT|nr:Spherulin-4 [Pseudolycoriella hygida]